MLVIKFSHDYKKFGLFPDLNVKNVVLQTLDICDVSELTPKFVEYDTAYGMKEHYPLPKGKVLVLGFDVVEPPFPIVHEITYSETREPLVVDFTTVRRWTQQKYDYYFRNIGAIFKVQINEGDG